MRLVVGSSGLVRVATFQSDSTCKESVSGRVSSKIQRWGVSGLLTELHYERSGEQPE